MKQYAKYNWHIANESFMKAIDPLGSGIQYIQCKFPMITEAKPKDDNFKM